MDDEGHQTAPADSGQPHTNGDGLTYPGASHSGNGSLYTHDLSKLDAKPVAPSKDATPVPPISPKIRHAPPPSPKVPRSPSLGVTVQKGLQRSPSSLSNHSVSSSRLSRQISSSSLQSSDAATTTARQTMRRSSTGLPHSSPGGLISRRPSINAPISEPQPPTAATVAKTYFERELAVHQEENVDSDILVVLHDNCYGHRFARPKTSKGTLGLIVERPERLHASVLGLSAAYVRLGGRHSEGQQPPHPEREIDRRLPFLIRKTARSIDISSSYVTNVHGKAWMEELKGMCNSVSTNLAATGRELARTPNGNASDGSSPKQALHEGDLYLSSESLDAFQGALGGVCDGIDAIFQNTARGRGPSKAFVCIRPPGHHCSSDLPSGFCWLNNVHVGIEYAAQNYGLTHAVILDFDLHHGDGSQSITWARNSKIAKLPKNTAAAKRLAIGYYSLHDINSFPCEWGEDEKVQSASLCIDNAHNQSVWNVHLEPWKTETEFWELYETKYSVLFQKARNFLRFHAERLRTSSGNASPRAAIFLSAGFDASLWEGQGMQRHKVNVPTDFFARFTKDAVKLANEDTGLGVDGRVISVLEGGYSDKALISGVMGHLSGLVNERRPTHGTAVDLVDGLGIEMNRRMGALSLNNQPSTVANQDGPIYKSSWWSSENLTGLEGLIAPSPPAPAPKKRTVSSNTSHYTSPTQSFTAKVVDPTKIYRSTSGYSTVPPAPTEPATFPIPEVDWLTAAGELSRLLVPQNRQTRSYRADELSEPRVKKERQSINVLPSAEAAVPTGRMQLRERKAKAPSYADPKSDDESRPGKAPSKTSRRRTIADVSSLSEDPPPPPPPTQQPSQDAVVKATVETTGKLTQEVVANGEAVPRPTKISIRTQKPTNPTAPGVTGRKKALEKPAAPSRTKSRTNKVQPPSTKTPVPKAVVTPTSSAVTIGSEATQAPQAPQPAEPSIDQITSSMQSKLHIGAHHATSCGDEATSMQSTEPVRPLVEERIQAQSETQISIPSTPGQPPHSKPGSPATERDPPVSNPHGLNAGNSTFTPVADVIPGPAQASSPFYDTLQPSPPHFLAHQTQDLTSGDHTSNHRNDVLGQNPLVHNQNVPDTPIDSQNMTTATQHPWPHNFAQMAGSYGSSSFHDPINSRPNEQKLPVFTSQGHIPFGSQQSNHQTMPPSNQRSSAPYTVSQVQTLASPDPHGRSHGHETLPAGTGLAADGYAGTLDAREPPASPNGAAALLPAPVQALQAAVDSGQPFTDLPPVPDLWDVPDTP
ncbi:MAG: hypothetical protein M1821_007960 [Bathelium mastoideum]|nr:MAG: hypothetical protein M1821_007960 [Bathelium mastoideum]